MIKGVAPATPFCVLESAQNNIEFCAMALTTVYRGTDRKVTLNLKNDSGDPVVINSLAGIIIWLYERESKKVFQKYSKNALAGHKSIAVEDSATGSISIQLTEADTVDRALGEIWAAIKTKTSSGSWEDGDMKSAAHVAICCIEDSNVKSVSTFS